MQYPCDEKTIPRADTSQYRRTGVFDQETVPKGLLERHTTKPGIWWAHPRHSGA
jgi:tellurite resistance-related uncharacterized protein